MVAHGLKRRFRLKRLHILMGVCALALMTFGCIEEFISGIGEPPRPPFPREGFGADPLGLLTTGEKAVLVEKSPIDWKKFIIAKSEDVIGNCRFLLGFWLGIMYFGGIAIIRFLFPRQSS